MAVILTFRRHILLVSTAITCLFTTTAIILTGHSNNAYSRSVLLVGEMKLKRSTSYIDNYCATANGSPPVYRHALPSICASLHSVNMGYLQRYSMLLLCWSARRTAK